MIATPGMSRRFLFMTKGIPKISEMLILLKLHYIEHSMLSGVFGLFQ